MPIRERPIASEHSARDKLNQALSLFKILHEGDPATKMKPAAEVDAEEVFPHVAASMRHIVQTKSITFIRRVERAARDLQLVLVKSPESVLLHGACAIGPCVVDSANWPLRAAYYAIQAGALIPNGIKLALRTSSPPFPVEVLEAVWAQSIAACTAEPLLGYPVLTGPFPLDSPLAAGLFLSLE